MPMDTNTGEMALNAMRRLWRAGRSLKQRFASHALILMYHRVTDLPNDPYLLAVTPEHFAAHMEMVRKFYLPIALQQLSQAFHDGTIPKGAIAVTFDDGFSDNLFNAKPILERYEIPATFFVTTGQIGSPREFWWDELDRLLLQPGTLPPSLALEIDGAERRWELADAATYAAADHSRDRCWHIEQDAEPTLRHRLHRSLYRIMHDATEEDREQLLEQLRSWVGTDSAARATHRTLSKPELVQLAHGGLVEIGAHTVSHSALAGLPLPKQSKEIRDSKACLEDLLNRPVSSFAYPYGSYHSQTINAVREAGLSLACSSDTAVVRRGVDRFRLPRMSMRNWDGEAFSRWVREWLAPAR
jgi:peptidoglycan/xylan/chitin deacetylase (PgdA/CDA1 family)